MPTIEIPRFWTFHHSCCHAMYGVSIADRTFGGFNPNGVILATETQAWDAFYDGEKRAGNAARKRGDYVKGSDNIDALGKPHADDCPTRSAELDKETGR